MASALFTVYKNAMLGSGIFPNILTDTVRAMWVDYAGQGGSLDPATATSIASVLSAARVPSTVAACPALSGRAVATGAFSLSPATITFTALTGNAPEALILFKDTGTESSSMLLVLFEDFGSGFPFVPNGGSVTVNSSASGLFSL